jgi:hypothetical protein
VRIITVQGIETDKENIMRPMGVFAAGVAAAALGAGYFAGRLIEETIGRTSEFSGNYGTPQGQRQLEREVHSVGI